MEFYPKGCAKGSHSEVSVFRTLLGDPRGWLVGWGLGLVSLRVGVITSILWLGKLRFKCCELSQGHTG